MIRAEQLQIGDWVKYTNPPYIKVECITKRKIGYHLEPNETRMHYVRLCEVEPIPLTKAILEKNGWQANEPNPLFFVNKEILSVSIWGSEDARGNRWYTYTGASVDFVHQLQQALRFRGINKTIEL